MARPKLDYTNTTIGTLLMGRRIEGTVHARFTYTCTSCGDVGERDARHIARGCSHCKAIAQIEGTDKHLTVATASESFTITPLQILMVLRKHPEALDTPDALRVRFYYEGKRVRVSEDVEYVHVSQAAKDGAPVRLSFSKLEQELDKCYSITLPEAELPKFDYSSHFGDAALPDPFATHHAMPKAAEPASAAEAPPKVAFVVPDGWIKLERGADSVWLKPDYPDEGTVPPYLMAWFALHPDCSYRLIPTDGDLYAAASVLAIKKPKPLFDFDELESEDNERRDKQAKDAAAAKALEELGMLPERLAFRELKTAYQRHCTATDRAGNAYNIKPIKELLAEYQKLTAIKEKLHAELDTAECLADIADKVDTRPKAEVISIGAKTPEQRVLEKLKADEYFRKICDRLDSPD